MTEKRFEQFTYFEKNGNFYVANDKYGVVLNAECEAGMVMNMCNDIITDMNSLVDENEQLKKELERCKKWLNSDKYDYETTLAFIKSKGFSLKDVMEYKGENDE